MKEIFSDELKSLELDILQVFHDFCIKNDINYSICGGTLLGAVRHKGFIPWDDDIDVLMTVADYEKFSVLFNKEQKNSCYRFINCFNEKQYFQPFGKIVNTKTVLIENYDRNVDCMGVYIDLFPVHGLPSDTKKRDFYWKKIFKLRNFNSVLYQRNLESEGKIKHCVRNILFFLLRFIPANTFSKIIYSMAKKNDFQASTFVACSVFGYGKMEELPKSSFNSYIDITFEDRTFKAMCGYKTYLSNLYGAYMELPPVEKQVRKHNFKAYWREI